MSVRKRRGSQPRHIWFRTGTGPWLAGDRWPGGGWPRAKRPAAHARVSCHDGGRHRWVHPADGGLPPDGGVVHGLKWMSGCLGYVYKTWHKEHEKTPKKSHGVHKSTHTTHTPIHPYTHSPIHIHRTSKKSTLKTKTEHDHNT